MDLDHLGQRLVNKHAYELPSFITNLSGMRKNENSQAKFEINSEYSDGTWTDKNTRITACKCLFPAWQVNCRAISFDARGDIDLNFRQTGRPLKQLSATRTDNLARFHRHLFRYSDADIISVGYYYLLVTNYRISCKKHRGNIAIGEIASRHRG